jgi:hypothetical protein
MAIGRTEMVEKYRVDSANNHHEVLFRTQP